MAKVIPKVKVTFECSMTISEVEARALDGLTGYSFKDFVDTFYAQLGKVYLEDHEEGLRSFFTTVREYVVPQIAVIDDARRKLLNPGGEKKGESDD